MKNETVVKGKAEGKTGLTTTTLPWWAKVLIAQHVEAAFPAIDPHHIHHCSDCGCVLISTRIAYQYFPDVCPDCSNKSKVVRNVPVPKTAFNEDRGSLECSKKNRSPQGGN
jgi:hypothetical protein